jgi:hypothetical protein
MESKRNWQVGEGVEHVEIWSNEIDENMILVRGDLKDRERA